MLVPNSTTSVSCGKTYTFAQVRPSPASSLRLGPCGSLPTPHSLWSVVSAQWIALGYDAGSTVGPQPPTATIIELARAVLNM